MIEPGSNGPPTGYAFDGGIPFDAPIDFDTGLYALPRKTLAQLREDMMVRLGYAAMLANPPPGMTQELNSFLYDAQMQLYLEYAPMRTERWWGIPLVTGQRFYQPPAYLSNTLDYRRLTWAGIADGETWLPIAQGIDPLDFTAGTPGTPYRFDVREYIEVWPAPVKPMTLWLRGHFGLLRFTQDTDVTTIDEHVVFLFALANAKAHRGQPDAGNYSSMARRMIANIVGLSHGLRRYIPRPSTAGLKLGADDCGLRGQPRGTWRD